MSTVTFVSVEFKNFFSFGNTPTKILLNRSPTTLIQGISGSGKSTILEALTFCLFGKPFRKINKATVLNTVNSKDCLTTVEMIIGETQYKIVRGIKPNIFEIWIDGVIVDQAAHTRDYQKYLEDNILQFGMRTWIQVIALGFASYNPFLWLSTGERRQFVDEILGTGIFQKMLIKSRERLTDIKSELAVLDITMVSTKTTIENAKSYLNTIKKQDEGRAESIKSSLKIEQDAIEQITESIKLAAIEIVKFTKSIEPKDSLLAEKSTQNSELSSLFSQQKLIKKDIEFFKNNEVCPSCAQGIAHAHSNGLIANREAELLLIEEQISSLNNTLNGLTEKLTDIKHKEEYIADIKQKIVGYNLSISHHNRIIMDKESELVEATNKGTDIIKESAQNIVDLHTELSRLMDRKSELNEAVRYLQMSQTLLKEDGIKSKIIKSYLPLLNNTINKYLDIMGFYMKLSLDEEFNETIMARFRDNMSFGNLSQGEQSRISIAILLAWRSIASSKHSVNTNLTFFDEILDSALSASDVESVMNMLKSVDQLSNIFIISHKPDIISNYVRSVITVEKVGNFSKIM